MQILKTVPKISVKEAAKEIKRGRIIVFPTDTVYGLLADATNQEAVKKVFKIKKRAKTKPLPVFVRSINEAKKIAHIDKNQEKFLKSVWPGKVTVVLKLKTQHPASKIYGVDKRTIALRIPDHKVISHLLSAIGRPLTGTSANISGKPASTKIKEVQKQFEKEKVKPDLIIDAGNLKKSKPSKIIDLSSPEMKILREGEIKIKWKKNH